MIVDTSIYVLAALYVLGKWVTELLLADMWNLLRRASKLLFSVRIIRYDDFDVPHPDFMQAVRWIGGHLWTDSVMDFLGNNHDAMTTTYAGRLQGPIFDDGLDAARQYQNLGFHMLCFGQKFSWQIRKSVDGWPVWLIANGIHSFIADEHKVLHLNSARFGNHRPVVAIVTLSFTPTHILQKVAHRLRILPRSSTGSSSPLSRLRFKNYHAIIRTEGKTAELEWVQRRREERCHWPNPAADEIFKTACAMIDPEGSTPDRRRLRRLNILLHGTYGTGKTKFAQLIASTTGAHLVLVTKESKWSAVLDAMYNLATGPKVILFDEFDTLFEDEDLHDTPAPAPVIMNSRSSHSDSSSSSDSRHMHRDASKSFISQGGVLNFRKTCAGIVTLDEDENIKESIDMMPAQLLQEHHLLSLLDGTAFSSYGFPVVCAMCTNFPDKIPERITRWGRVSYRLEMKPHTLETALAHAGPRHAQQIRTVFRDPLTPALLQSWIDTAFIGVRPPQEPQLAGLDSASQPGPAGPDSPPQPYSLEELG